MMQLNIGLFFGGAYLSYWLLVGLAAGWRWGRTAWQRRGAVKHLLEARQGEGDNTSLILVFAFIAGALIALILLRYIPAAWLLLGLPVLVMALEELVDLKRRALTTDVIVLIEKYKAAADKGLAGALGDVLAWLPEGPVRAAVEEAQHKRWEDKPPAECLRGLRKLKPHTREFVDALGQANYEAGALLDTSLEMLLRNKKAAWASQNRTYQVMSRLLPVVPPIRLFALGGLASAFMLSVFNAELNLADLQPKILAAMGAALLGIWALLRLVSTQPWLRRALASAVLVLLLLSFTSFLQEVTPDASPALAATLEISPTFTPPPPPMSTNTPDPTAPLPPVSPPTGRPTSDKTRDPSSTPGTGPGETTPTKSPTPPPPPPTATGKPTREPSDTPPPLPDNPTDTPPPPPENATNTPPAAPGGDNP